MNTDQSPDEYAVEVLDWRPYADSLAHLWGRMRILGRPELTYEIEVTDADEVRRLVVKGGDIEDVALRNVLGRLRRALRAHAAQEIRLASLEIDAGRTYSMARHPATAAGERAELFAREEQLADELRRERQRAELVRLSKGRGSEIVYAAVAQIYVDCLQRGSRQPIRDAASDMGMEATPESWERVRKLVAAARREDGRPKLLTGGGSEKRKKAGALTPYAVELLRRHMEEVFNGDD